MEEFPVKEHVVEYDFREEVDAAGDSSAAMAAWSLNKRFDFGFDRPFGRRHGLQFLTLRPDLFTVLNHVAELDEFVVVDQKNVPALGESYKEMVYMTLSLDICIMVLWKRRRRRSWEVYTWRHQLSNL
ncbi:hypothetical protein L596_025147 [Steinernema carpocapsae]|uniref:Uncharacterized protein n=1 Tax=Steinernema carpocapsae TaxID=34508 RepID=A0A4U5M6Y6_STECR|nr:hypothetical protein L596_025147 [Steinernema carpocapsae]